MKFSTRARYGLRMMVELARELQKDELVRLGKIAEITGVSSNYLAQLAISLKNDGLLVGVSGKKGGYRLARPAGKISVSEIVKAVIGPINLTDCVADPVICYNSSFCEARTVWALVNWRIQQTLEKITLSDLIDNGWMTGIQREHPEIFLLFPDQMMSRPVGEVSQPGCPSGIETKKND